MFDSATSVIGNLPVTLASTGNTITFNQDFVGAFFFFQFGGDTASPTLGGTCTRAGEQDLNKSASGSSGTVDITALAG